MRKPLDKHALVTLLDQRLQEELDLLLRSARDATDGATHADVRSEGDKDMRATEASYQAAGQWKRVQELEHDIAALRALVLHPFAKEAPIALSAIAHLKEHDGERLVMLMPAGGGEKLTAGRSTVVVVTAAAPLGTALLGRHVGDEIEVRHAGKLELATIVSIE